MACVIGGRKELLARVPLAFKAALEDWEPGEGALSETEMVAFVSTAVNTMADAMEYGPMNRRVEKSLEIFRNVLRRVDETLLARITKAFDGVKDELV